MCGINGIIFEIGVRAEPNLANAMALDMAHRGPDAQTNFTYENFSFSHRRLKIIDISDNANQPIFNENRKVAVVFNGEIYNFKELRNILINMGHIFQTNSDTEIIVHAFEEWNTDAFLKFNGIFAFALWDGRSGKNKFYLVRDRVGAKPLFYSNIGGKLAFSSELKPLLRLPWISKSIEPHTLFEYLKYSHVPNPHSIIKDVQQLEPGHYLFFEEQLVKKRYWDSLQLFESFDENSHSTFEWERRFEECLHNVVARQVVSDVPIGCFLSGGIDSSLLAMAFSELGNKQIETFSIGYREQEYDETPYARFVAEKLNTLHHEIIVEAKDFIDLIPNLPIFFDQPLADPTQLSSLLLSKFAKNHVTVVLAGDGADELFWGYDYQKILSSLRLVRNINPNFKNFLLSIPNILSPILSHKIMKFMDTMHFRDENELIAYYIGTAGPMRLNKLAGFIKNNNNDKLNFHHKMARATNLNWEDKISYAFQNTFLVDTVLAKSDRASMAYGLETRVPFLDNEMLDFSQKLPFDMKFRNGISKYLLRSVLGKRLPKSISNRSKQGFSIPLQSWLRTDLKYLLDEYIFSIRYDNDPFLVSKMIHELGKEHMHGMNHSHLLWSIINFRMWQERYLENA